MPRDMRIRCLEPGSYLAKSTKRAGEENEACLGPRRKTSEELAAKQIHRMQRGTWREESHSVQRGLFKEQMWHWTGTQEYE